MCGCKLIVGLGNPGRQYENTRHNAGFWFVDRLARLHGVGWSAASQFGGELARFDAHGSVVHLLKPMTYMNHSGRAVGAMARYYKIPPEAILVVHDELDFEPGVIRLKRGGGHGGHNGLRDIVAHLGAADFLRLRVGIGHPGERSQVVSYVLSAPSRGELSSIEDALDSALSVVDDLVADRYERAIGVLHAGVAKKKC